MLTLLQRHFTAVRAQTKSQAHLKALRDLKNRVKELEKLENAVYEARGADEDVVESVLSSPAEEDEGGALRRSRVMKAILVRWIRISVDSHSLMDAVTTRALAVNDH